MKHTAFSYSELFERVYVLSSSQLELLDRLQRRIAEITLTLNYPNNTSIATGEDLYSLLVKLYEEAAGRFGIPYAFSDFWVYRVLEALRELPDCVTAPIACMGDDTFEEFASLKALEEELRNDTIPGSYRYFLDLAKDFGYSMDANVYDMVTSIFLGHDNVIMEGFLFRLPARLVAGLSDDDVLYHASYYADVRRGNSGDLWVFCSYPLIGDPEGVYVNYPEKMLWDILTILKPSFVAKIAKKHLDEIKNT